MDFRQIPEQLRTLWARLSRRQQISIGVAAAVLLGGLLWFGRYQREQGFKPLFENMAGEDAATVLNRLRESGTEFRLANNGTTIKVPAEKLDELRIQMAAAGLPKSGRIGFELFDKTNFGASEFAEQVNYHRAMEGELERSILAIDEVEAARVHLTFPKTSLFAEKREAAKASAVLRLKPGAHLAPANVTAIGRLIASAVDGLAPEQVSIVDMRGRLLSEQAKSGERDTEPSEALTAYRTRLEDALRTKIEDTLTPMLGSDRFRAAVSLECDLASGDQSEETFDPTRSVMTQSQRSEENTTSAVTAGVPGTPSTLPRPLSRPALAPGTGLYKKTENTSFQTSRLVRRLQFPQGQVRRLSVAVLVDHLVRVENGRRVLTPPSPEQLKSLREVVAGAVGYQESRGDLLSVEALPFESTVEAVRPLPPVTALPQVHLPVAVPDWLRVPLEGHLQWALGQRWMPAALFVLIAGLLAIPVLILRRLGRAIGAFLARRAAKAALKKAAKAAKGAPALAAGAEGAAAVEGHSAASGAAAVEGGAPGGAALPAGASAATAAGRPDPRSDVERLRAELATDKDERDRMKRDILETLRPGDPEVSRMDVLLQFIHEEVQKDPERMAHIVRAWIREQA